MADISSMPDSKYAAGVYGSIDYSSNSVTTNFVANYETGSYINEGMKQEVVSKLSNFNRLGYELNYGLYGILYKDTLHGKRLFNFFFSLSHKDYFNTLFTY